MYEVFHNSRWVDRDPCTSRRCRCKLDGGYEDYMSVESARVRATFRKTLIHRTHTHALMGSHDYLIF